MRNGYRGLSGGPALGIAVSAVGSKRANLRGCSTCSGPGTNGLGISLDPATKIRSSNNVVYIDGTLTALEAYVRSKAYEGSSFRSEAVGQINALRAEFAPLRQRVKADDYDYIGTNSADDVHDHLLRIKDAVDSLKGKAMQLAPQRGEARAEAAAAAGSQIAVEEETRKKKEDERRSFLDRFLAGEFKTYLYGGGGLVGLILLVYLFGPLIRGAGARATAPKQLPATTSGLYLLR
jgi:hypothetical protein